MRVWLSTTKKQREREREREQSFVEPQLFRCFSVLLWVMIPICFFVRPYDMIVQFSYYEICVPTNVSRTGPVPGPSSRLATIISFQTRARNIFKIFRRGSCYAMSSTYMISWQSNLPMYSKLRFIALSVALHGTVTRTTSKLQPKRFSLTPIECTCHDRQSTTNYTTRHVALHVHFSHQIMAATVRGVATTSK